MEIGLRLRAIVSVSVSMSLRWGLGAGACCSSSAVVGYWLCFSSVHKKLGQRDKVEGRGV